MQLQVAHDCGITKDLSLTLHALKTVTVKAMDEFYLVLTVENH